MVRGLAALLIGAVALLFLYAPANHPRDYFIALLVQEHQANAAMWGEEHARRVLGRMQALAGEVMKNRLPGELGKPLTQRRGAAADSSAGGAAANDVADRIVRSDYVRSMDGMFALASYRFAALAELVPVLLPFMLAALGDGIAERARRAKEFVPHTPGVYGAFLGAVVLTACGTAVVLCLPRAVDPLVSILALVLISLCSGAAIARYLKYA